MNLDQLGLLAEFLKSANITGIDKECLIRSSASKQYYELFHLLKNFLSKEFNTQYEASGGGTHEALQVCCSLLSEQLNDENFSMLELKLRSLHQLRVKADYKLDRKFTNGDLITMEVEKKNTISKLTNIISKHLNKSA